MKLTTFKNKKGMIHGGDTKRICSAVDGVLKIGTTEISVSSKGDSVFPILYYGGTGDYKATFTDICGRVYDLGIVTVREGRVALPTPTQVELMELRCRADIAEDECELLREEIEKLQNIFDTNSLNFLIK